MPEPGPHEHLVRVSRAGVNFADTHASDNTLPRAVRAAADPRRRGGRQDRGRQARRRADRQRRLRRVRRGPEGERLPDPVRRLRRPGARAAHPGPDRLAPVPHLAPTCARARPRSCTRRPAASARSPSSSARRSARASSPPPRPRRSAQLALELGADAAVDVTREDLTDALIEANDGRRVDVVLEMAGGRVFDASLRALAPFGRLVTYGMASREPNQRGGREPDAPLVGGDRLLARALLHAAAGDARRAAAGPLRARGRAAR